MYNVMLNKENQKKLLVKLIKINAIDKHKEFVNQRLWEKLVQHSNFQLFSVIPTCICLRAQYDKNVRKRTDIFKWWVTR